MRITQKLLGVGMLSLMAGCSTLSSMNPFASKPKGNLPAPLVDLKGSMAASRTKRTTEVANDSYGWCSRIGPFSRMPLTHVENCADLFALGVVYLAGATVVEEH